MKPFLRKVIKIQEEWMEGDLKIGIRRIVHVIELECGHWFWEEISKKPVKEWGVCESCFRKWCLEKFGNRWGKKFYGVWDKLKVGCYLK